MTATETTLPPGLRAALAAVASGCGSAPALARRLGVSATAARAAVRELTARGLLAEAEPPRATRAGLAELEVRNDGE